jgi:hypothetical protein
MYAVMTKRIEINPNVKILYLIFLFDPIGSKEKTKIVTRSYFAMKKTVTNLIKFMAHFLK